MVKIQKVRFFAKNNSSREVLQFILELAILKEAINRTTKLSQEQQMALRNKTDALSEV